MKNAVDWTLRKVVMLLLACVMLSASVPRLPAEDETPQHQQPQAVASVASVAEQFSDGELARFSGLKQVTAVFGSRPFLHEFGVRNFQFVDQGRRLLTTSRHGLREWDVESQKLLREIDFNGPNEVFMSVSQAGDRIALAGDFGSVGVLEWPSGRQIATLPIKTSAISAIALSPDGKTLAISAAPNIPGVRDNSLGVVHLWTIDEEGVVIDAEIAKSFAMTWWPDSSRLAVGARDATTLFVSRDGEIADEDIQLGVPEPIVGLDFDKAGRRLAVKTQHGSTGLWTVEPGAAPEKLWFRKGGGSGQRLVEGATGGVVIDEARGRVYIDRFRSGVGALDLESGELMAKLHVTGFDAASDLAIDSTGKTIVTGDRNGDVIMLKAESLERCFEPPHKGYSSLQFIVERPETGEVLTVSGTRVDLWSLASGQIEKTYRAKAYISAASFDKAGNRLALARHQAGRDDETQKARIELLDVASWKVTQTFTMDSYAARGVAFSPDERDLFGAGVRGCYHWNVESGERVWKRELGGERDWLEETQVSPDGKTVAVVRYFRDAIKRRPLSHSSRTVVALLNAETGEVLDELVGPGSAEAIVFSNDGGEIYATVGRYSTGQPGETIPLVNSWDVESSHLEDGHRFDVLVNDYVGSVSINTRLGRVCVSAASEFRSREIHVRDLATGEKSTSLVLPGYFRQVLLLNNGKQILAGRANGAMLLMNAPNVGGEVNR